MKDKDEKAWFEPMRYGYGAGLPITWQGWLASIVFLLTIILSSWFILIPDPLFWLGIQIAACTTFILLLSRTTRGGWRWRWGDEG